MPATILETLPGIHVTVIGIGAAFLSAFVMFAFQKMLEAKDDMHRILEELKSFSTPTHSISHKKYGISLNDEGEVDWHGDAKNILFHAKSLFSYIDYEEKYGIPKNQFTMEPDPADVVSTCHKLCSMLYYVFVSYPFTGNLICNTEGVSDKVEKKKNQAFSYERLNDIENRIIFLCWCWDVSSSALIELGRKCTELERQRVNENEIELHNRKLKEFGKVLGEEKVNLLPTSDQIKAYNVPNYDHVIAEYFNKAMLLREGILPRLKKVMTTLQTYDDRFKTKSTSMYAIKLFVVILLLGVVVPITLGNLRQDFCLKWHPFLDYFLMVITMTPYFHVCNYLYKKISASDFK